MVCDDKKKILTERLQYFVGDVFPCELLPWLTCLTEADKQQIRCDQDRHGDIRATDTMVDRLKRRQDGFSQFVIALRENGSEHVAMLLDPEMKVENPGKQHFASKEASFDLVSGTVVDMRFKGRISNDNGEDLREVEAVIADEYGQPSSAQATQLRRNLSELLPPGAVFYKTKKGSVVCVFRVCRVSAAQELWEMYRNNSLHEKILQHMLTDELKEKMIKTKMSAKSAGEISEAASKETPPTLKMQLFMMEERFEEAVKNLKEIESSFKRSENSDAASRQLREDSNEGGDANEAESLSALVIPPVYLDSDQSRPHSLALREYQKELATPALKGQNTIICAPANSGKTYVAIHIARHHLDKYSNGTDEGGICSNKKPKVIFIVSTLSLVLQQKERFEYFLNDKYRVADISGGNSTEVPLEFLLSHNDVVILTAQILVNSLKNKTAGVKLTDISMLMFDECHHTNKDHPYNKIMERFMVLKKQPGMKAHSLPQVIGLTASLGVGKSKTLVKAKEHILKLCSNLDAELISTVKENVEELRQNVNLPESKLHSVSKPKDSRFEIVISKVMDVIERKVGTACGKPPQGRAGQDYRQWVESLYNHAVAEGQRFLVTFAEQLREYHISLTIYDSTRLKDARRRLEEYFKGLDESKFTDIDRKLKGLYTQAEDALSRYVKEHGEPQNPMLVKLKELVVSYHTPTEQTICHDSENSSKSDTMVNGEHETSKDDAKQNASVGENISKRASTKEGRDAAVVEATDKDKDTDTVDEKTKEDPQPSGTCNSSSSNSCGNDKEETESSFDALEKDLSQETETTQFQTDTGSSSTNEESLKIADKVAENNENKTSPSKESEEENKPKGIIFTQTRESTKVLEEWVAEDQDLKNLGLKPLRLLGSGDGRNGMTQNERDSVIEKFKRGDVNLIIATTVAEEGLDIKECNYVIRYNMTGNEISSVQSRGRVRTDMGEYNVLAGAKSGVLEREHLNQFKEMLMTGALAAIQNLSPGQFKEKIGNLQERALHKFRLREGIKCLETNFDPNDISFHCRKCNDFACQAHEIKRIQDTYHVIPSKDFLEKATIKTHPNPKTIDGITKKDKIHCGTCGEDWGITIMTDGIELPCIKVSSFVLRTGGENGRGKMYRKWSLCPFKVKEVDVADIAVNRKSGNEDDGDGWEMDFN